MAHTNTNDRKKIRIGSCLVYTVEFSGSIPTDADFETEANKLGDVSGGATLEYKPSFYTAKSDDGTASKPELTDEEATLKLGVCTWNANTLKSLVTTGSITEVGGIRTLKIGGKNNSEIKKYAVRCLHKDKADGDTRTTIVGNNTAGFSLAYVKDKETVINPEFKIEPMDADGTLIIYSEEILGLGSLALTLAKGSTTGKTKVNTVSPTATGANTYVYKIAASAQDVSYDAALTTGWTAVVPGTTDIAATAGQVITVAEVDSSNKAKAVGTVTVIDNIA